MWLFSEVYRAISLVLVESRSCRRARVISKRVKSWAMSERNLSRLSGVEGVLEGVVDEGEAGGKSVGRVRQRLWIRLKGRSSTVRGRDFIRASVWE